MDINKRITISSLVCVSRSTKSIIIWYHLRALTIPIPFLGRFNTIKWIRRRTANRKEKLWLGHYYAKEQSQSNWFDTLKRSPWLYSQRRKVNTTSGWLAAGLLNGNRWDLSATSSIFAVNLWDSWINYIASFTDLHRITVLLFPQQKQQRLHDTKCAAQCWTRKCNGPFLCDATTTLLLLVVSWPVAPIAFDLCAINRH